MNNGIIKRMCVLLAIAFAGMTQGVQAQSVAVKSNVLADAFLNPNLGIEVGLAPKWTLDVTGQFNAWMLSHDRHWKHWVVQPEARYWFCDRFSGHFVGAHIHGGQYNIGGFDGKINFLGTDTRKRRIPLPGLVRRRGYRLWLCVDTGAAWNPGGRNRLRLFLYTL